MKLIQPLLLASLFATGAFAADYTRVIFADDFSAEGFGPRWGHYKSSSVVKDGVLVGITAPTSDHSAVDNIRIDGEKDLEVSVKFRFVSDKAKSFNVWFDDKGYKGSHAGHICQVTVSPTSVNMADAKTGAFTLEGGLYDRKKANQLTDDEKKMLAAKAKREPVKLSLEKWHTLVVQTKGDEIEVTINGKKAGSFKSEGIAHETKSLISLTTNAVDVEYDDFSIKGVAKP
ncbi:family 16 glycoside hydrolase [Prosthecobacter sp. SYSU 5D2]|uniref:family 16 glycoside hydrolase n=1 Tax=Prosthecobacter sp. SYSU 5D2 TaxID=3134134 RepID=UPI0031FE7266